MQYSKGPLTISDHIKQLQDRGLAIDDEQEAAHFLSNISYYRLAGYWWPMQSDKTQHIFKANSRFEDVIALYNFDRELRLLLFDAIERIEIALRTKLIYHLSHEVDPWWFTQAAIFIDSRILADTLDAIEREVIRSKDTFIKEHYRIYHSDRRLPPAWKTLEVASFGNLSKLYGNLNNTLKSKDVIAREFNTVNHTYLPSWLQAVAHIRNICAHHGRLWNKKLLGRPKLLSRPPATWLTNVPSVNQHNKLYIQVCCIKYLLDAVSPGHHLSFKLKDLFEKYPSVDLFALGFSTTWKQEPLWSD